MIHSQLLFGVQASGMEISTQNYYVKLWKKFFELPIIDSPKLLDYYTQGIFEVKHELYQN